MLSVIIVSDLSKIKMTIRVFKNYALAGEIIAKFRQIRKFAKKPSFRAFVFSLKKEACKLFFPLTGGV